MCCLGLSDRSIFEDLNTQFVPLDMAGCTCHFVKSLTFFNYISTCFSSGICCMQWHASFALLQEFLRMFCNLILSNFPFLSEALFRSRNNFRKLKK